MYNDPNQPQPPYGRPPQEPTQYAPPAYNQPPQGYGQPNVPPQQYEQPQYGVPPVPSYAQPARPKRSLRWLWITLGIVGGILLLSCAGCVIFGGYLVNMFSGPQSTINNYYSALEQQDYAKAYTYWDTSNMSPKEQSTAQQLFVFAASATDKVSGKITSYSITSTNVNNDTATLAVDEKRSGQTMHRQYILKKVDNTWKISSVHNSGS